jgi:hypothetical protein
MHTTDHLVYRSLRTRRAHVVLSAALHCVFSNHLPNAPPKLCRLSEVSRGSVLSSVRVRGVSEDNKVRFVTEVSCLLEFLDRDEPRSAGVQNYYFFAREYYHYSGGSKFSLAVGLAAKPLVLSV